MQLTVNLSGDQKKGIRYLGIANDDLEAEFENSCNTIADGYLRKATDLTDIRN